MPDGGRIKRSHFGAERNDARPPVVLIVESDALLRRRCHESFSGCFSVRCASTGREALSRMDQRAETDLAIVDYRLPDMPGIEVLAAIKRTNPSIPVIMTVAYGNEDTAVNAFRCGARDYVKKPFDPTDLVEKIRFYLSLRNVDDTTRKAVSAEEFDTSVENGPPGDNFYRIRKVLQYLDANYMFDCSLQKAAGLAYMSRRHFSRIFKSMTGMSFRDHLSELRMKKACEMMRSGSATITTISHTVGYNDITCFARLFKKITGKTPSDYRTCIE